MFPIPRLPTSTPTHNERESKNRYLICALLATVGTPQNAFAQAGGVATKSELNTEISARVTGDQALQDEIDQEIADRTELIRQEADGSIHIGANSLITQEVGGTYFPFPGAFLGSFLRFRPDL